MWGAVARLQRGVLSAQSSVAQSDDRVRCGERKMHQPPRRGFPGGEGPGHHPLALVGTWSSMKRRPPRGSRGSPLPTDWIASRYVRVGRRHRWLESQDLESRRMIAVRPGHQGVGREDGNRGGRSQGGEAAREYEAQIRLVCSRVDARPTAVRAERLVGDSAA